MQPPLRSIDNPLVKRLVRLHRAEGRREHAAFLVEGRRAIDGFLAAGAVPDLILVAEGEAAPAGWPADRLRPAAPRVLARLSQATTPSGFLASIPLPTPPPIDPAAGGLVLVGVADPGNLGSLLRSAAAFAVRQVVLAGCADPYGAKAVQATAGAAAALALHRLPAEAGPASVSGPGAAPLCALVVAGGAAPEALPRGRRWLVVGSEAHGLGEEWLAGCAERVTLPMPGRAESLNAAVAGGIALYLFSRA